MMGMVDQRFAAARVAYAKKIRTAARQSEYVSPDHSVEDMEQELMIVLWQCCEEYDPARGASFNAYFWMRARQRIFKLRDRHRRQKRTGQLVVVEQEALEAALRKVHSAEEEYLALEAIRSRRAHASRVRRQMQHTVERYASN